MLRFLKWKYSKSESCFGIATRNDRRSADSAVYKIRMFLTVINTGEPLFELVVSDPRIISLLEIMHKSVGEHQVAILDLHQNRVAETTVNDALIANDSMLPGKQM